MPRRWRRPTSACHGRARSDAALEQAEVILMHDRIENFLAAQRLSRRAARSSQNLASRSAW